VEDGLAAVAVGEGGGRAGVGFDAVEEVFDGVGEGVLVADDVAAGPPDGVGVAGRGDVDVAETLDVGGVVGEENFEFVHLFEVENEAAFGTVDLEGVVVGAAGGGGGGPGSGRGSWRVGGGVWAGSRG